MLPHDAIGRIRRLGVLLELVQQHLHHAVKAVLVLGRVDGQLIVVVLPRREHQRPRQTGRVAGQRPRDDRQRRPGPGAERDLRIDRALRGCEHPRGELVGRDRLRRSRAVDAVQQLARLADGRRRRQPAVHERTAGLVMLDPEDRRLQLPLARPREQHDQQLGVRALDPHRLLDRERPHPRGGGRHDPLPGEALRARVSLPGERLRRQHRERGEHPGGVGVAARLERLDDRRADLRRELGLGERDEQAWRPGAPARPGARASARPRATRGTPGRSARGGCLTGLR